MGKLTKIGKISLKIAIIGYNNKGDITA